MQKKADIYVPTFFHYLVITPIFVVMKLLLATVRFQCSSQVKEILTNPEHFIGIAWHRNISLLACAKTRFRPKINMSGLVSASKDAAYLVAFFNLMKIRSVRGSHKRRGREAILDLVDELKNDSDAFITPDGPRGPARVAKRGFYAVAKASGARVLLVRFKPKHYFEIPSWDKMVIPLPFSSALIETMEFKNIAELDALASLKNKSAEEFATDYMNFKD